MVSVALCIISLILLWIFFALLCAPWYHILINAYEDEYPLFKQETVKRVGQLYDVFVFIIMCKGQ